MLNELTRPMLSAPTVRAPYCLVCHSDATDQHHVIQKGMGGAKEEGPTLSLCRECHDLAHNKRLHFRWVDTGSVKTNTIKRYTFAAFGNGHWEYIRTEPCKYEIALECNGWERL